MSDTAGPATHETTSGRKDLLRRALLLALHGCLCAAAIAVLGPRGSLHHHASEITLFTHAHFHIGPHSHGDHHHDHGASAPEREDSEPEDRNLNERYFPGLGCSTSAAIVLTAGLDRPEVPSNDFASEDGIAPSYSRDLASRPRGPPARA